MTYAKNYLFIINNGPYGNERSYNGLRTAMAMAKREAVNVRIFLIGDGVQCASAEQHTPRGYFNIERMMASLARRGEVST
jgi:uncharacterized protein involved in oxidation of intracellular sulfur